MNTPVSDHPIACSREAGRVEVLFAGHEIADSADVVILTEADYAPVRYFPRADVAMAFLQKTDKVTHCPHKGQATYYTIHRDAQVIENAVWSYEDPLPGVSQIAGRLAFYPEHVTFRRAAPTRAEARAVDVNEVIRHTDSGSGSSQAEHWEANVSMPDDQAWEGDDIRDDDVPSPVAKPYEGTGSP